MHPGAFHRFCHVPALIGVIALLLAVLPSPAFAADARPNVLFVAVDDLKPTIGAFGDKIAITPAMDALAARGVAFQRAYCQQAVCSPSRTSLLLGRRPDTTKVYDLEKHFRSELPDVVTLPQHFKNNGYHAVAMGKIYHGGLDDAPSWSEPHWTPKGVKALIPDAQARLAKQKADFKKAGRDPGRARGVPYASPDVADEQLADGAIAGHAIELLQQYKKTPDKPFFLAVGFLKPHLPFIAPKKYFDLYKPEQFTLPAHRELPKDAPAWVGNNSGELRAYLDIPASGPVPEEQARNLIHAYYAATSYMDAQLGRVLAELDRLDLARNTVVVLWGDHGWSLGEHGLWCKHTNYEDATRAPLIIAGPGVKAAGAKPQSFVEFVDIYPTLSELAGLPLPAGLEGTSFKPLLQDPSTPWKKAAFSQYPRAMPPHGPGMGYAMRTDRYRLVEWRTRAGKAVAWELYDHQTDPAETVNLAGQSEHQQTLESLKKMLADGWEKARP